MDVYFMRHGQTDYNLLGLCNDDPRREVHLTEAGRHQAEAAGEALAPVPLALIIVSELPRTRETALIINRRHHAPLRVDPRINDIRTGFDGAPVADFHAAIRHDRLHAKVPGGESILEYKARVTAFLRDLTALAASPVLVVCHEETLRVVIAHYRGLADRDMLDLAIGNCEVVHFTLPATGTAG